jgi:hypothetical protein
MKCDLLWECELYERTDDVDDDTWIAIYYVNENFMNAIYDDVYNETYCEIEKLLNV